MELQRVLCGPSHVDQTVMAVFGRDLSENLEDREGVFVS